MKMIDCHIKIDTFCSEIARCFGAAPVSIVLRQQEEAEMAFEQKDNSGSIWINDRKDQDTHPDRTGTARIGGADYWVNGWLRKTKDGKPYLIDLTGHRFGHWTVV